jgi:hypothetical protein
MSTRQQPGNMLTVDIETLGLDVRPHRSANVRPLVPQKPEPAQAVIDGVDSAIDDARLVSVLDPKDESPALMASKQPIEQSSARTADVEVTCRTGCEAHADGRASHVVLVSNTMVNANTLT